MKKIIAILFFFLAHSFSYSQSNGHHNTTSDEHWNVYGNTADASDVIGTANAFPLNFITNGITNMILDANGNLQLINLKSTNSGNRILLTDPSGFFSALPQGSSGQFLQSNGTWGNLPASASIWNVSGSKLSIGSGNFLGIGTNNPIYPLDVVGDARISNNLTVGGGVIVTQKLDASIKVQAGDIIVNNNLDVTANSNFGGNLKIASLAGTGDRSVYVDAGGNLRTLPSNPIPSITPCVPGAPNWHIGGDIFGTALIPIGTDIAIGTCDGTDFILKANNSQKLWIKPDGKIGFNISSPTEQFHFNGGIVRIDDAFSLGTPSPSNPIYKKTLVVGGDVSFANYLPTGASGNGSNGLNGIEILGGDDGSGSKIPTRRGITTDADPNGHMNFYINSNQAINGFNFKNGNGNITLATIDVNGKLLLNSQSPTTDALSVVDISTGKTNFKVFTDGRVYGREMIVTLNNFPDYVFSDEYNLMKLSEVKVYTQVNHRLPNMPSAADVEKLGANIGEIQRVTVEKVEELYKYIFEMETQIKELKKELSEIKNK